MGEYFSFRPYKVVGMRDNGSRVVEPAFSFRRDPDASQPLPNFDGMTLGERIAAIDRQMRIADKESGASPSAIKSYVMGRDGEGHQRLQRVERFPAGITDKARADVRVRSISKGAVPPKEEQKVIPLPFLGRR